MSAQDCIDAIKVAAPGISDDQIEDIFLRLDREKKRLEAEGNLPGIDQKLFEYARQVGREARLTARGTEVFWATP